jgi:diguanylate cyclase (GGDEF)-like protein
MTDSVDSRQKRFVYFFGHCLNDTTTKEAEDLKTQLGYFGYIIQVFFTLSELASAIQKTTPFAIILDLDQDVSNDILESIRALSHVRDTSGTMVSIPIVYISTQDDLKWRLLAVRTGGFAYFLKPVDIGILVDALDRLTSNETITPYRVLIVDDSPLASQFSQRTLQQAGMETEVVNNPLLIMPVLLDFNPDLILLDVYMPDCTGMELAKVIRQIEKFVSIPIVYLSSEDDKDTQLQAMKIGGDDFINKQDLRGYQLTTAIQSRVERYRKLRSLMMRDSLTGLLNHTALKERLNQEIGRAKRSQTNNKPYPVSFAMMDIDHFKSVNDSYGHPVGDRVIKSLSRFIQQRMRLSDTIGRYGGEEFAIIMPGTHGAQAVKVMDEIREGFSHVRHQADDHEFFVTFSCGVASFPEYDESTQLNEAADQALYAAKHSGRNRVFYVQK